MPVPFHTIKVAAKITGLTTHAIRMWEKRYGAVVPTRSGTKRRLFDDKELERLTLLRKATELGYSIGSIANLEEEVLRAMVMRNATKNADKGTFSGELSGKKSNNPSLDTFVNVIQMLDSVSFEDLLMKALLQQGAQGLLVKTIAPLTELIGELWAKGTLTAAHEHFASVVIREFLISSNKSFVMALQAPVMIVSTPLGQLHELGAVIVANAAINQGWRVVYLGPGLPAADIAAAAVQQKARVVALSIVFPENDSDLPDELASLRKLLPSDIKILVGGRAASHYQAVLNKIKAVVVHSVSDSFDVLKKLRAD